MLEARMRLPDLHTLRRRLAREQRLLLLFIAIIALGGGFALLASEMLEGDTSAIDVAVLQLFRLPPDHAQPIGPEWLPRAVRDVTALGSVTVLTFVTVLVVVFLLLRKRSHQALLVALAVAGGRIASVSLKSVIARPRPDVVPHLVEVSSLSFPSGHAMNSAIVYLTLAVLLSRAYAERAIRVFILGTGLTLTILIGMTRVYLGVHYPSDVLGGWMAGACWALAMSGIARTLQRRGQIEPPETLRKKVGAPDAGS